MAKNNKRGSKNNNPEGRNQYSGWMDSARDRPMTTAAAAAAAVGAGVFLWSRRSQIGEQLGNLGDQIGEWTENMNSDQNRKLEMAGRESDFSSSTGSSASGSPNAVRRNTGTSELGSGRAKS